jgi:hypothetical protein
MEVRATGTKKFTEGDKARIRELMGPDAKRIQDGNPRALLDRVRDLRIDIVIAGGRNSDRPQGPPPLPGPQPGARLRLNRHGRDRPHPGKPHLARRPPPAPRANPADAEVTRNLTKTA